MSVIEIKKRLEEVERQIGLIEVSTDFLSWDDKERIRELNAEARALEAKLADIEK